MVHLFVCLIPKTRGSYPWCGRRAPVHNQTCGEREAALETRRRVNATHGSCITYTRGVKKWDVPETRVAAIREGFTETADEEDELPPPALDRKLTKTLSRVSDPGTMRAFNEKHGKSPRNSNSMDGVEKAWGGGSVRPICLCLVRSITSPHTPRARVT